MLLECPESPGAGRGGPQVLCRSASCGKQLAIASLVADSLDGIAATILEQNPAEAARLLGAAEDVRSQIDADARSRPEREVANRAEQAVRSALGEQAFKAAHADGKTMPLADAVQLALALAEQQPSDAAPAT
jgi:hypothetical protein